LVTAEIAVWLLLALAALGCAGIWPLIVATAGSTGRGVSTTIVVASGGIGAAVFPYIAGRLAEVLPGHLIPAAAAPLLLVVLYLSGLRPGRAQEAAAAG
jgi:fucose permease